MTTVSSVDTSADQNDMREMLCLVVARGSRLSIAVLQRCAVLPALCNGPLSEEILPSNFPFAQPTLAGSGGFFVRHGDIVVPKKGLLEVSPSPDGGRSTRPPLGYASVLRSFEKAVVVRSNSNAPQDGNLRTHTGGTACWLRRLVDGHTFGDDGEGLADSFSVDDLALAEGEFNPLGITLLHLVIMARCSFAVIEFLLQRSSATVMDASGRLPFAQAIEFGHDIGVLELLLRAYPEAASTADGIGALPLMRALQTGHPCGVIDLLVGGYPDAVTVADDKGRRPLDVARELGKSAHILDLLRGAEHEAWTWRNLQAE